MQIIRIVPGRGCESLLIKAGKTALWDTGMYYCAENCLRLVKEALEGDPLDYIILSHSHYDHIGALSDFRREFPEAKVIASEYCAYVFTRDSAKKIMKEMSESAAANFGVDPATLPPFDVSGFYADRIVGTGDIIDLTDIKLEVYNTPGHTRDSISLFEPTSRTLIISESCGIAEDYGWVHIPPLTSCGDCLRSIELCESLHAETVYCPHHGLVSAEDGYKNAHQFFARGLECFEEMKKMARACVLSGMDDQALLDYYVENVHDRYIITEGQPEKAFRINTEAFIRCLRREYPEIFEP